MVPKNRYLTFIPGNNPGREVAYRVTLVDSNLFSSWEGKGWWVQAPVTVSENSGTSFPTPNPSFKAATVGCNPAYTDWSGFGTVHVSGAEIVPSATYHISAIAKECNPADLDNYTAPLVRTTAKWGDIVGDCTTNPCSPPNGIVDGWDITAVLDKFMNKSWAVIKARADIDPNVPDRFIQSTDIAFVQDAFNNKPYPTAPPNNWKPLLDCPPLAPGSGDILGLTQRHSKCGTIYHDKERNDVCRAH